MTAGHLPGCGLRRRGVSGRETIRGVKLELVCGDIAKQPDVEAVVNAAIAELGRQDFEELGKQFEKIAKGFSKADVPTHSGIPTAGVGSAKVVVTTFLSVSESGTKYGSSMVCPKVSLTIDERQ